MCHTEYHFDMDKPKTITNDKIRLNEKNLLVF